MKKNQHLLTKNTKVHQENDLLEASQSDNVKKIFIVALIITAGFLLFKIYSKNQQIESFKNKIIPEAVKKVINDQNTKITVDNVKETSGVFEFELKLGADNNGKKYTSYITKDGKILFVSGIKLENLSSNQAIGENQTKKLTCADLSKSEKPSLTAFVVSQCPYGIQMQRVFKKAIEQIPQLISYLTVKYIGAIDNNKITSMHGDKEAQENLNQICIREEQQDRYWPYVSCYIKEGKGDECLKLAGVNDVKLKACVNDPNRGLKYAKADFDLANKFNIGGSPTLLLNGKQIISEFDFGGRVADAIRQIACCGAKNQLPFCQKEISKENLAISFSKEDVASGSNTSSGCQN